MITEYSILVTECRWIVICYMLYTIYMLHTLYVSESNYYLFYVVNKIIGPTSGLAPETSKLLG